MRLENKIDFLRGEQFLEEKKTLIPTCPPENRGTRAMPIVSIFRDVFIVILIQGAHEIRMYKPMQVQHELGVVAHALSLSAQSQILLTGVRAQEQTAQY